MRWNRSRKEPSFVNTFVGFGVGLLDLFDWIEAGDAYPLLVVDVLDIFK